jgi:transposase
MMGRLNRDQEQLFYSFCLDDVVPEDHLVRQIGAVLDLSWVRTEPAPHYFPLGRPSIDPVLMIRMLIVGYVFAIRSERAICREVQVNLAYRWFCGLSIEDTIPDHSAFSRARNERFRESDVFRRMFERVVLACIAAGLVGGEGFAVDASLIEADANRQRSVPGSDWSRERAPQTARRAVKEYLSLLDDAAWGGATEVVPKFVSPSDPASQWTGAMKGPAFFAYADNYLIDVRFGIIVDVEASRAIRQAEVGAAKTMLERTEARFGLKPDRLAADSAYGSAPMLNWLVEEKKIAPHIPVIDKSQRDDGTFSRSDFRYDAEKDIYHCPGGKELGTSGTVHEGKTLLYRASKLDCDQCPLKSRCCPKEPARKIPRDIHEHARDVARSLVGTDAFEQSRRDRKRIEMRFAHLKRILRLGRLRLRGPRGAQDEFVLAAIAQNLRRFAKLIRRPLPVAKSCFAPSKLATQGCRS